MLTLHLSKKQDLFTDLLEKNIGMWREVTTLFYPVSNVLTPYRRESERCVWAGRARQPVAAPTSEFHHPHDVLPTGVTAGILYPQGELCRSPSGEERLLVVKRAKSAPDWLSYWASGRAQYMRHQKYLRVLTEGHIEQEKKKTKNQKGTSTCAGLVLGTAGLETLSHLCS